MEGLANILVGLAALAALAIAVLAHDWRDEFRDRMLRRRGIQRARRSHMIDIDRLRDLHRRVMNIIDR